MIDNSTLVKNISDEQNFIKSIFAKAGLDDVIKNQLLEYSLIKCVVKTQQFISLCFDSYASGDVSSKGYIPKRKLAFVSPEHLHNFFDVLKKGYMETLESGIKDYSKHIFLEDPFALIVQDTKLWSDYNKARIIRNYLMHQSGSAEKEYREHIPDNKTGLIEPYKDLLKMTSSKSLYSQLTESLSNISEILVNPTPFF